MPAMSDLEPQVCVDPRVYNNTAGVRVRCVPLPGMGTMSAGTGAVSFSPTRTVPVRNPRLIQAPFGGDAC
jgi:hypothetical protein